jgi:hypothetical protein
MHLASGFDDPACQRMSSRQSSSSQAGCSALRAFCVGYCYFVRVDSCGGGPSQQVFHGRGHAVFLNASGVVLSSRGRSAGETRARSPHGSHTSHGR